jgi:hypothetical protein
MNPPPVVLNPLKRVSAYQPQVETWERAFCAMPTSDATSATAPPAVDETRARRAANGYLGREVGISFGAVAGVFVPLEQPIWQFAIEFHLPRLGPLGVMGTIDVNADTGEPLPLSHLEIEKIQDRADAIIRFHTPAAAA